jgi:hypothetical protein
MKFTIMWNEADYVWPVGTGLDDNGDLLDGKNIAGEQMKLMARVKEDNEPFIQVDADISTPAVDLGLPDTAQFDLEFPVPRGKTLEVILIPVLNGVEGEASTPVESLNPTLTPPRPEGVTITLRK